MQTTYEKRMTQQAPKKDSKGRVWVKVSIVKQVTVWKNYRDLEAARENDLVVMRWFGNKIFYDLNSINPLFLKK